MSYQPTTNFKDSNGVDLGKKLVTNDYLLEVYGSILNSIGNSGLITTPTLWTCGENGYGQLGVNDTSNRSTPVTTLLGGTNWKQVSSGFYHISAIKVDGTLWSWGSNKFYNLSGVGQLGVNDVNHRSTPVTTLLGGTNWKQVSCGRFHTVATKTDGSLWTWGYNANGQLGINDNVNKSTPVTTLLGGTNWKSISCGGYHTIALKTDGSLWSWGENGNGQLGVNNTTNRNTPVTTLLGGTNWKQISGGDSFTAAVKTDGTLWTWGQNQYGQLGLNDLVNKSTPVTTLLGGTDWKQVSCGFYDTAAIKTDGSLWGCGLNNVGALGIGDAIARSTPSKIGTATNWKSVVMGVGCLTAIKTDGSFWISGDNATARFGTNNTSNTNTPVTTILGGNNWKSSGCNGARTFTVAIQSLGTI